MESLCKALKDFNDAASRLRDLVARVHGLTLNAHGNDCGLLDHEPTHEDIESMTYVLEKMNQAGLEALGDKA